MEVERLTKRTEALRVEGSRIRGIPRLTWEDCVKRDLAGMGGEWIIREKDRRSGDDSETGSVTKKKVKQNSKTGIGASLTPDYSYKEKNNNIIEIT